MIKLKRISNYPPQWASDDGNYYARFRHGTFALYDYTGAGDERPWLPPILVEQDDGRGWDSVSDMTANAYLGNGARGFIIE